MLRRAEYREWVPHVRKLDRRDLNYRFRLIVGGKGHLSVDQQLFTVTTGDVLILPPGARHGGTTDPRFPLRSYWISGAIRVRGAPVLGALDSLPPLLRARRPVWRQLARHADEMCREIKERGPAFPLFANAALARFIALLWREAAETGALAPQPAPSPTEPPWLRAALDYMTRHYAAALTLGDIAGAAHLSRTHFSTAFRRATGFTPFDYLRRYRLQRAKELLAAGASVSETAAATGFADPSYFGRAFARADRLPPSRFKTKRSPDAP